MNHRTLIRAALACVLAAFLASAAASQDIIWVKKGLEQQNFGAAKNPTERAEVMRKFLATYGSQVSDADILICKDDFDFGKDYPVEFPLCSYVSDNATWRHQIRIDEVKGIKPPGTTGFILNRGARFFGFKFSAPCHDKSEDGGLFCSNQPGDIVVEFTDCFFDCGTDCDWGAFYAWRPGKVFLKVSGGGGTFCRKMFSLASSGDDLGQTSLIENFTAIGRADGSTTFGASSRFDYDINGDGKIDSGSGALLVLLLQRNGTATLRNVSVTCYGQTAQFDSRPKPQFGVGRIAGLVSDQFYSAGRQTSFTLDNCTSTIIPGPIATVVKHSDVRYGKLATVPDKDKTLRYWSGT